MALSDYLPAWARRARVEPVELPKLPGGAPVGDVLSRQRQTTRQDPFAIPANAGPMLVSALRSADSGYLAAINAYITGTLVYDTRLSGVARARILAITSRRWAIRPPVGMEQDRTALFTAQTVSAKFYETPGFSKRRAEIAQGILRQSAVLEHQWIVDKHGDRVSRPKLVDPERIDFDIARGLWTVGDGEHRGRPLSDWPDKFIIHSPTGGLAIPEQKRGALRPMLALALVKRFGVKWWAEMLERFGQPQVYGTVTNPAAGSTTLDELVAGLRMLSSQWTAAFRGDVKLEALPVDINDEAHRKFVDWVNTEYAVNLLGGNLTTEVKDGQTYGSTAQAQVRGDILAADLVEIDETITDQWIEPMVRFNMPGAPCPVIESVATASRPWALTEYQAGLCTLDEFRTTNGHDALGDARGATFATPSLPASMQGTQVLSMPHPLSLPPGGAAAGAPFPTSTPRTSATSLTRASGPARLLSQ